MSSKRFKTSRREFLAGVAGAVMGLAVGAVAGATAFPRKVEVKPWLPAKWDYEADVVVIGSGAAGLAAAIEAADHGASVIVLEKLPWLGGATTALSGGIISYPIKDKINEFIEYCTHCGMGLVDRAMVETWAKEAVKIKEWLTGLGAEITTVLSPYRGFYHMFPYWDVCIESIIIKGAGKGFADYLIKAAQERKVQFLTETKVMRLIADAVTREVFGVVAKSGRGEITIKARKAVILATGGFGHNEEMKKGYLRVWPIHHCGYVGNTGDGILIAQQIGAKVINTSGVIGNLCHKFPEDPVAWPSAAQLFVWGIIVNKYGKRFAPEDWPYDVFHKALWAYDPATNDFPNIPCYIIFDENIRKRGPMGYVSDFDFYKQIGHSWSIDNNEEIRKGWIIVADTVKELARKINIHPNVLEETITEWNRYAKAGQDLAFGRKTNLEPLESPPFYAIVAYPGIFDTYGGLKIDTKARVLDINDKPIPRLYAAGATAAGVLAYHYPISGSAISVAISFGRIAGRNAAAESPR